MSMEPGGKGTQMNQDNTMKYILSLISIVLLTLAANEGVTLLYSGISNLPPGETVVLPAKPRDKDRSPVRAYSVSKSEQQAISARNIFDVATRPDKKGGVQDLSREMENLEKTELDLILWGTVSGKTYAYAVIQEKKNQKGKNQSLYQVGDRIQNAVIKTIARNKVILTLNGKDQVLEVATLKMPVTPARASGDLKTETDLPLTPNATDDLNKHIKFRPFLRSGVSTGLMVYGIRSNSPFRKSGLKNGDIVTAVNGSALLDIQDGQRLFQELTTYSQPQLDIIRRGKPISIMFSLETASPGEQNKITQ